MRKLIWVGVMGAVLMWGSAAMGRVTTVRVLDDETGKVIAGATVMGYGGEPETVTDANGEGKLVLPDLERESQIVVVEAAGHAAVEVMWPEDRLTAVPESYTARMPRGVEVGGVVVDEAGKPIENARVRVTMQEIERPADPFSDGGMVQYRYHKAPHGQVVTDAAGRWKIMGPAGEVYQWGVSVEHAKYYAEDRGADRAGAEEVRQMREKSLSIVMKPGAWLKGQVRGTDGGALAHAKVFVETGGGGWGAEAETDAEGKFLAAAVKPGKAVVEVAAAGHALTMWHVDLAARETEQDFTVGAGKRLEGEVMTKAGKPVVGANVFMMQWLGSEEEFWRSNTDAEGKFLWDGAPEGEVVLGVDAGGVFQQDEVKARAGVVTKVEMDEILCVRGKVLDGQTREAIQGPVHVALGTVYTAGKEPFFKGDSRGAYSGGEFAAWIFERGGTHYLRVDADGYFPEVIGPFEVGKTYAAAEVKLTKGVCTAVAVRTAEGKPAAGAEVALVAPGGDLEFWKGAVPTGFDQWERTDGQGMFVLQPHRGASWFWIGHAEGYAWMVEKGVAGGAALKPWGVLKGEVRANGKSLGGAILQVSWKRVGAAQAGEPRIEASYRNVVADENGQFVLPRLMDGTVQVKCAAMVEQGGKKVSQDIVYPASIRIQSGQTSEVVLDDSGATVVGKLVVPGEIKDWKIRDCELAREGPALPVPAGFNQKTEGEKNAWLIQYWQTEDKSRKGMVDSDSSSRLPVELSADGTFRVGNVAKGTYGLFMTVQVPRLPGKVWHGTLGVDDGIDLAGVIACHVVVGNDGRQTIDLGELTAEPYEGSEVGDMAPDFCAPTLEGKVVRLSELRGKWVFLDLWGPWCSPCVAELPEIKKIYDGYGVSGKVVVLGVAWDEDVDEVRRFIQEKEYPWTECVAGSGVPVQMRTYLGGLPQTYLIDPAGKIVVKDWEEGKMLEQVKGEVEKKKRN